jgi:hypothetical protein
VFTIQVFTIQVFTIQVFTIQVFGHRVLHVRRRPLGQDLSRFQLQLSFCTIPRKSAFSMSMVDRSPSTAEDS